MHFNSDPPGFMAGVWVALEDMDLDNGPLVYYPGSQRLSFAEYSDVGFDATSDQYESYEAFIADRNRHYEEWVAQQIRDHGYRAQYGTISRGQALIWSANLLHGGSEMRDTSRTRHSQVTHYLFEGSKGYYTPMRTEGDTQAWTEPEWVV
jgi:ectoine hydroxylase-related dioxygenase (phytanoyl-CoA dioxygenase family)